MMFEAFTTRKKLQETDDVALQNQHPKPEHFIVHISDTHLISGDGTLYGSTVHSDHYLKMLMSTLEASNARPEAFIFTGDLADQGEIEAYVKLRKIVEPFAQKIGAEVIWAMGNHDNRQSLRVHLLDQPATRDPLDMVYDLNGLRVIVLDSTVPNHHYGLVSDDQLEWLTEILRVPAPHGTILAMHHPPLPSVLHLAAVVELQDQKGLEKVLVGSDVRSIIAGHLHYSSFGVFAGIPVSVASATCYTQDLNVVVGGTRGRDGGQSFNLIHVYDETILHSVVPLIEGSTVGAFVSPEQTDELLKLQGLN